jgi:hypothetical protein
MPPGHPSWPTRSIGLALARRYLMGTGQAARPMAPHPHPPRSARFRRGEIIAQQESVASLRGWAAKLSFPFVEVLMLDDHVIVQQEDELVASGFLLAGPAAPPNALAD